MNRYGLAFHHLGLAVTRKEKALAFLRGLGYVAGEEVFDPLQKVRVLLCQSPEMPMVEIISRGDGAGPLDTILKDHSELIYHICYTSRDIASSLKAIQADGRVLTVSEPKPAVLFDSAPVSFHIVDGFGLIEILEQRDGA
jgi:hypothetical protein